MTPGGAMLGIAHALPPRFARGACLACRPGAVAVWAPPGVVIPRSRDPRLLPDAERQGARRIHMPADSIPTGIEGLDLVLGGGLPSHRIYLVQGDPGVGKTTLGMEFLISGAQIGEKCLYIALSETATEIRAVVDSHGWTLDGIEVMELSAIDQTRGL